MNQLHSKVPFFIYIPPKPLGAKCTSCIHIYYTRLPSYKIVVVNRKCVNNNNNGTYNNKHGIQCNL